MGCIFLRPFGVPMVERVRLLLYWPHTNALWAYNGGTGVGHGPFRTLFLEPDFVPSAGTLDLGHGPVTTLFLGLIWCLVPMTTKSVAASPLPSGRPKRGGKCYITHTFSGIPKQRGAKSMAAAPLPSRGPKRGRKCYITHAFSGIPKQRGAKSVATSPPAFLGAQKRAKILHHPLHSRGSPNKGGQNQWLPHPCLLRGPKEGGNATSTLHSRGSPNKGGQNQKWLPHPCLLGAQKMAKVLHHHVNPCYVGRLPTNWWPRRVLCALWTQRPIVKVAMVAHRTGSCTDCTCIAKVAFLPIFQFFLSFTRLTAKKNHTHLPPKRNQFFLIIYTTYRKKNITRIYRKKNLRD